MSVLLLSGGVDSAVLLADLVAQGQRPVCMSFYYGQRHQRELKAARHLAHHAGCRHEVASLPEWLFSGSSLTGKHDAPLSGPATVVPGRNLAMISLAVAFAASRSLGVVYVASHAGDREVYPDCRTDFVAACDRATSAYGVRVEAPYLTLGKAEIVTLGRSLGVDFAVTYSCYRGERGPCGACGACTERKAAGL